MFVGVQPSGTVMPPNPVSPIARARLNVESPGDRALSKNISMSFCTCPWLPFMNVLSAAEIAIVELQCF